MSAFNFRRIDSLVALVALLFSSSSLGATTKNTTYHPRPYEINVDPAFIEETRLRAANYRPTPDLGQPAWFDGPPSANVSEIAKYWANDFNFTQFQYELNHNFSNYMTTVPPPSNNYTHPVNFHFIHQKSKRGDAIPLLMLHGWPSTSLEWADVIPGLVNPPNSSLPAFDVVAPDLPGFGWSPALTYPFMSGEDFANVFAELMEQLGYKRYVLYSTDLGFIISRYMVPAFSERILNHVTDFFIVFPNATDLERAQNNQTTPDENAYLSSLNNFVEYHSGYSAIQSTLPLSQAYSFFDSPIGFLAWIWQGVFTFDDTVQTAEKLIRRTLPLYILTPYANIRAYKPLYTEFTTFPGIKTKVPTSVTQWGGIVNYPELANTNFVPLEWVERTANVTYFNRHSNAGGHFPAESQPQAWLEDMWAIFADGAYRS